MRPTEPRAERPVRTDDSRLPSAARAPGRIRSRRTTIDNTIPILNTYGLALARYEFDNTKDNHNALKYAAECSDANDPVRMPI